MDNFLEGLKAALSNEQGSEDEVQEDEEKILSEKKQVHFNSKIIVNHTSFISSRSSCSVNSNFEDGVDPNNILVDKELEDIESERETSAEHEEGLEVHEDRLFSRDPPSSLFDVSGLTKSALSIQNDPSLSEMVTPLDPTAPFSPVPKPSPKPNTRLLKFDWQKVGGKNPNPNADPFVDQDKELPKSAFVIKSPFKPSFKSFLSAEMELEEDIPVSPAVASCEVSDDDETIKSADIIREDDSRLDKQSGDYSWIDKDNPLELYNQAHSGEIGGSLVQDDFFELQKEMDEKNFGLDEQFNNNILLPETEEDDALSGISCSDFPTDGRKDEFSSILPASFEQQTPHNHTRTMQSISDELFSPGSFFASRSGQLGDIGSKDQTSRPTWYTPKHDAHGRLIDPIGITPNHRPEKSATTDTNVRHPLYVPTPSANRKIAPISLNSASSTDKLDEQVVSIANPSDFENGQDIENNNESGKDPIAHLEEAADSFDWQNALEVTIPDTTVAEEEQSANVTFSSCSSLHSTNRQKQHMKISFVSSPSSITCCFSPSTQKASQSMILELINDSPKPNYWSFNLVGSCSLTKNNITDTVSDPIFRSECAKGKLEVRGSKFFKVRFMPVQKGFYRALFHLKINSRVINVWFEGNSGAPETTHTQT